MQAQWNEKDININDGHQKVQRHARDASWLVLGCVVQRVENILAQGREQSVENLPNNESTV